MQTTTVQSGWGHTIRELLIYSSIGFSTFVLDILMLYVLIEFGDVHYLTSAGISFLGAVSVNYLLSRHYIFPSTRRSLHAGYIIFLLIAGVGLVMITTLMYIAVGIFAFNYLLARIVIAGIVGLFNYFMNLHYNFGVTNREPDAQREEN